MKFEELAGLEHIKCMIDGRVPHASIADTIPMRIVSAGDGYALIEARADKSHLNPLGGVHGGFAATVLDGVTASAVHTMMAPGEGYATLEISIKMFRPVPLDEKLFAEGKIMNISRSVACSEGWLRNGEGKILAYANATFSISRKQTAF